MITRRCFLQAGAAAAGAWVAWLYRAFESRRIDIISHRPEPSDWNEVPRFGEWQRYGDNLMRIVYRPARD